MKLLNKQSHYCFGAGSPLFWRGARGEVTRRCKCFVLFGALLFIISSTQAQTAPSYRLVDSIGENITNFTTDNLGNVFLVNKSQQVKKVNSNFDSVGIYNDVRRYGELSYVDASNPLKVLLFYKDFMTIIVLDRLMNVRNTIDLRQSDILQCSAITNSYDNNIWLFDELDSKIKKIDENGKPLQESADFRILFDNPPRPRRLEDFDKYLYAYDSTKGLLLMDYYGAYKKLVPIKNLKNLEGVDKGIMATDSAGLVYLQPDWLEPKYQTLPKAILAAQKLRFYANRLYALQNGQIYVYERGPL